jgi:hypothetical protein
MHAVTEPNMFYTPKHTPVSRRNPLAETTQLPFTVLKDGYGYAYEMPDYDGPFKADRFRFALSRKLSAAKNNIKRLGEFINQAGNDELFITGTIVAVALITVAVVIAVSTL